MTNPIVDQAARNNALWCDAVCATHAGPGEFHEHFWINRLGVPPLYPDVVTLAGAKAAPAQTLAISAACEQSPHRAWAVKDSFGCLDLAPLGFKRLFDAQWLFASPGAAVRKWDWSAVDDAKALSAWEQSWRGSAGAPVFKPRLLSEPDILFLFVVDEGEFSGGGILNRGASAVGISNVFGAKGRLTAIWAALADAARSAFPGLPIVAYEHADDTLIAAIRAGFSPVGRLRIWSRAPLGEG